MSYAGTIRLNTGSQHIKTLDLSTVTDKLGTTLGNIVVELADGSGANQAQVHWHDTRTVASGANDDLDLAGALAGAFGVVTFAKIKAVLIRISTLTTGYTLEVLPSPTDGVNAWLVSGIDSLTIGAGGTFLMVNPVDGYTVTAGSADKLRITNPSAGAVTYSILIVGTGSVA